MAEADGDRHGRPSVSLHRPHVQIEAPPSPRIEGTPQSPLPPVLPIAVHDPTVPTPPADPQSLITQVVGPDEDLPYPSHLITQVSESDAALLQQQQRQPPMTVNAAAAGPATKLPSPSAWQQFLACCGCVSPPSSENGTELVSTAKKTAVDETEHSGSSSKAPPAALPPLGRRPSSVIPERRGLLGVLAPEDVGKKCLVLDLDETLVHSSFKPVSNADFIIPVEIDGTVHSVYVLKRPGVDEFLQRLGDQFEVVVFTASLSKYADPVLDMLDRSNVVKWRLFREACVQHKGNYVKDLSQLGRELKDIIILDNSPASYIFHPTNAVPISSWFNDPNDTELTDLIPFLEDLKLVDNVATVLGNFAAD
ncbi:hypothetical protein HK405_012652 [Cladochytrium tenue]|nr:hypothetical protein HK405_012652 [Cladochytrium tenue]